MVRKVVEEEEELEEVQPLKKKSKGGEVKLVELVKETERGISVDDKPLDLLGAVAEILQRVINIEKAVA